MAFIGKGQGRPELPLKAPTTACAPTNLFPLELLSLHSPSLYCHYSNLHSTFARLHSPSLYRRSPSLTFTPPSLIVTPPSLTFTPPLLSFTPPSLNLRSLHCTSLTMATLSMRYYKFAEVVESMSTQPAVVW